MAHWKLILNKSLDSIPAYRPNANKSVMTIFSKLMTNTKTEIPNKTTFTFPKWLAAPHFKQQKFMLVKFCLSKALNNEDLITDPEYTPYLPSPLSLGYVSANYLWSTAKLKIATHPYINGVSAGNIMSTNVWCFGRETRISNSKLITSFDRQVHKHFLTSSIKSNTQVRWRLLALNKRDQMNIEHCFGPRSSHLVLHTT